MDLDELLRLAENATPGPYYVALDDAEECGPHKNSGLSLVDTGRTGDWPIARLCETQSANLIAACSPEVILKLLAVIRAADAMREHGVELSRQCIEPPYVSEKYAVGEFIGLFDGPLQRAFDAARAALEG